MVPLPRVLSAKMAVLPRVLSAKEQGGCQIPSFAESPPGCSRRRLLSKKNYLFAESPAGGSRRRLFSKKKYITLPRALLEALGEDYFKKKINLCRELGQAALSKVAVSPPAA